METTVKTRPRRTVDAALRNRIEKAVEKLIAALDQLDATTEDLEDGGDDEETADEEPSLGSTATNETRSQVFWIEGLDHDLEDEHDGAEPTEDDEPSLGSFDRMTNQTK